ncbi:MAG: glycosyltransferase family 2 protein [Deltaproteobacteria bacterium]|nr:glycosyltransferase family 2 protein [Deltaproteobacteria bacterium]
MKKIMEANLPQITTIITTYQRPKMLRRAILSVLNQTHPYLHACVYDNASGDGTKEVVLSLAKQDNRVKYFCHSENIGGLANLEYGMSQVQTPFFSILSDDDFLLPNFYEDAMTNMENYPEAVFCAGSTIVANENAEIIALTLTDWQDGIIYPPEGLLYMWEKGHPTWTTILFRSKVLKMWTPNYDVKAHLDAHFEMQIAKSYPFYIFKKPCGVFVFHPNSYSTNMNLYNDVLCGWRIVMEYFIRDKDLSEETNKRIYHAWETNMKRYLLGYMGERLFKKEPVKAVEAAMLYRQEFGSSSLLSILLFIARLGEYSVFCKWAASTLFEIRKRIKVFHTKKLLHKQYKLSPKYIKKLFYNNNK